MELLIAVGLGLVASLLLTRPKDHAPGKLPQRTKWADPALQKVFDRSRKR